MLPKTERLKERYLFNLVFNKKYKKSHRLSSDLLVLYYLLKKKDVNNLPKVAFVVGLSIDKKSNKRNLIKRRMRAAYRLVKKKIINPNTSKLSVLIWIANPAIKNATFEQIKTRMDGLVNKAEKNESITK